MTVRFLVAVLALCTTVGLPGGATAGGYNWPLPAPHPVLRPFLAPADPYGPGHRGVDLGAPDGSAVFAAAAGIVMYAGTLAGRGVVSIQHADGLRTTYEPVDPAVHRADRVALGQLIGHLRRGHDCRAGPAAVCLHWGARRGPEYLDPLGLLANGRVRLLPWKDP